MIPPSVLPTTFTGTYRRSHYILVTAWSKGTLAKKHKQTLIQHLLTYVSPTLQEEQQKFPLVTAKYHLS